MCLDTAVAFRGPRAYGLGAIRTRSAIGATPHTLHPGSCKLTGTPLVLRRGGSGVYLVVVLILRYEIL